MEITTRQIPLHSPILDPWSTCDGKCQLLEHQSSGQSISMHPVPWRELFPNGVWTVEAGVETTRDQQSTHQYVAVTVQWSSRFAWMYMSDPAH